MVSAATEQAVRASISTPVRSTVSTWHSTSTELSSMVKFTYTLPTSSGWHSGRRFGVCFAAWIPATRATASTSPLVIAPEAIIDAVSVFMSTRQRATALRCVASLGVTSTMRARPSGSRWVNSKGGMVTSVRPDRRRRRGRTAGLPPSAPRAVTGRSQTVVRYNWGRVRTGYIGGAGPGTLCQYLPGRTMTAPSSNHLADTLGRPLRDLRISVTDRCNFRCPYCMPAELYGEEYTFLPRSQILSFEEIERLARIFIDLGVAKIRLTGGEPLVRAHLPELVERIAAIDPGVDLTLTTNGALLAPVADDLAKAGLRRITVSLDTLDPAVFTAMCGRDNVHPDVVL